VAARAILVPVVLAAGWLAYRMYPAHHPQPRNPGFVDNIFANNLVLFATRLVLVSAGVVLAVTAVYVILSMTRWMSSGQLLTKFGPFEVQAVEKLDDEAARWRQWWIEETRESARLRARLAEAEGMVQRLPAQRGSGSPEGSEETGGDGEPA
jgi:hypothetical protein